MARLAHICLVCDQKQAYGIRIGNKFICEACEKKMISTETNDSRYLFYLKRLEKLKEAIHT